MTSAILNSSGKTPSFMHRLNNSASKLLITGADTLTSQLVAERDGVLLATSNLSIIRLISYSVIGYRKI